MEPGVLGLCESTLATLGKAGASVEAVKTGFAMDDPWHCWLTTLRKLSRVGLREWFGDPHTRDLLKPEAPWEIERSYALSAADIHAANDTLSRWYTDLNRLFEAYDLLVQPTAQVFPFDKK